MAFAQRSVNTLEQVAQEKGMIVLLESEPTINAFGEDGLRFGEPAVVTRPL